MLVGAVSRDLGSPGIGTSCCGFASGSVTLFVGSSNPGGAQLSIGGLMLGS